MVVLGARVYVDGDARERAMDGLESLVAERTGDLSVEASVGLREDGFPSVTLDGPDATAARNLLIEEFGEVVPDRAAGETYVGTLSSWDEDGFTLNVGFGDTVKIPASNLELGPGTPSQIRERFGLVQHLPLRFVAGEEPELAPNTLDQLHEWQRGEGRVNVNSATRAEVRATVNRAGHAQDVVTVERLGILEQSIVCREGTDPPGLLASVGRHLRSELLCVVP